MLFCKVYIAKLINYAEITVSILKPSQNNALSSEVYLELRVKSVECRGGLEAEGGLKASGTSGLEAEGGLFPAVSFYFSVGNKLP